MKKLLFILLCLPILFSSCEKEEESNNSSNNSSSNNSSILTWEKTYFDGISDEKGGAFCINQTSDGGYIFLCNSVSYTDFFMKINENGNEEWRQEQFDPFKEFDFLAKTSDDGYIIAGTVKDNNDNILDSLIYLLKVNQYGNQEWNKVLTLQITSESEVKYIAQSLDNGFIISKGNAIIKTNSNGSLEWEKNYEIEAVNLSSNGGFIIVEDDFLTKIDSQGNIIWQNSYTCSGCRFKHIEETSIGGYILTGHQGDKPDFELLLAKADQSGNLLWSKNFGGIDSGGEMVKETNDGGFIIIGSTETLGDGSQDVFLVKTDANGNQIISKTFGGSNSDSGESINLTNDGGYILGAETQSFTNDNIYVIKVNENGNL